MGDFVWKIWAKKWGTGLATTLVATAIVFTTDYINATNFPPEYAFLGGLAVIILNQISNYLKHR